MNPLREIPNVRQITGEHRRRWFESNSMDLIVWVDGTGAPIGFQLCYDKGQHERAVTLLPEGGLSHASVDDGEDGGSGCKETPVLVTGGYYDRQCVRDLFDDAKAQLPEAIATFVSEALAR